MLEKHFKMCLTARYFEKNFLAWKPGKLYTKVHKQTGLFWLYWKIWSFIFSEFGLKRKFILFAVLLHKAHAWEKSGSLDMGQNAPGQSLQDF